jgi:S-layer homology domain
MTPTSTLETWKIHVGESFPDVPTSQQFYKYIENLFHNGVTGGCAGGNYCPDNPVTRAQMAVFLLKGEHGSGYAPPPCATTVFTDEPCPGGVFVDWVNQLAAENITGGCGGGNYCPEQSVTRGQMSAFLLKGEHGGSYVPPACSATVFTDVVCPGAQFVNFINQLAAEGITGGCGGGDYCPGNPNTRGQMAVFLVKTFGLLLYRP